jgi:hypothetical protein
MEQCLDCCSDVTSDLPHRLLIGLTDGSGRRLHTFFCAVIRQTGQVRPSTHFGDYLDLADSSEAIIPALMTLAPGSKLGPYEIVSVIGPKTRRSSQNRPCRPDSLNMAPVDRDLGRLFLYARYNADLSTEGLDTLGCGNMDPEKVQKLDAVDQMDNLLKIGLSAGEKIKLEHFGPFAQEAPDA